MPALADRSSGATPAGRVSVARGLHAAYARERLEEVIRAIVEDALSPSQTDLLPWRDETLFEDELGAAVRDITDATNVLLVARLTDLLDTAPPTLVGRLAAAPRFSDLA